MKPRPLILAGAALLIAVAGRAAPASARTERFALVVGNNSGDAGDTPLRFAEADATRLAEVLTEIGGYPAENVVVARRLDGGAVRRALIAINDRIRRATATAGSEAVLLVYYSGHADAEGLHLGRSRLDVSELRDLVSGSAAQFRILVLDSCRSGALTRAKGGHAAPPFEIRTDQQLTGEGLVFLTSATANEDAQESDAIGGSVFTHYLVSGLLGAADDDGDGRVSLDEVYRYAYDATVRTSSRTLAGAQHPTFQFQLRGRGDLALSYPGDARGDRGAVVFPAGRPYLVMRGGASGSVIAEVAAADRPRRISVAPGRYFVRGRVDEALLEGTIDVTPAGTTTVDESRLERIEYARLVRKGSGDRQRALGVAAGYRIRTPLWSGASPCQGAFASVAIAMRAVTLVPRVGFCASGFESQYLSAAADELDTALALLKSWDLRRVSLSAGVEAGTAMLIQRFTPAGGGGSVPGRTSGAAHAGGDGQLELPLGSGFHLLARVGVHAYVFQQQDGRAVKWNTVPTVNGGLGVGRYW